MILPRNWPIPALLTFCFSLSALGQPGNGNGNGPGGVNGAVEDLEDDLAALTQEVADLDTEISGIQADLLALFTAIDGLGGGVLVDSVDCLAGDELQAAIDDAPVAGAIFTISGTCDSIVIRGKQNISLTGDGSAQISNTSAGDAVTIASSGNIQLTDIAVLANSGSGAMRISSASVKLDDVDLSGGFSASVLVDSNSSVDITGNASIDRLNAFGGIAVRNQSTVYSGGSLAIGSSIPGNQSDSLDIRTNSSFVQYAGYLDIAGRMVAQDSSNIRIINGDLTGSQAGGNHLLLLTSNSHAQLTTSADAGTITAGGGFNVVTNGSLRLDAFTGSIIHSAITPMFIQRNSSLFLFGSGIDAQYDSLFVQANSILETLAVPASLSINDLVLETGSGAKIFGFASLVAICGVDQAVWTEGGVSCL